MTLLRRAFLPSTADLLAFEAAARPLTMVGALRALLKLEKTVGNH